MPRSLTLKIAKERGQVNLGNHFEYGHDASGGAKAGKEPDSPEAMKKCLDLKPDDFKTAEENKERIERQNFKIKPVQELPNSETKNVGDHKGKGINNIIDQDSLKRSNMPFAKIKSNEKPAASVATVKPPYALSHTRNHYNEIKSFGSAARVPFSPEKRNRVERSYNKFDRTNGYGGSVTG